LAAELQKGFDVEAELIEGRSGIFDVEVDGEIVFSKGEVGRFPEADEVSGILRSR